VKEQARQSVRPFMMANAGAGVPVRGFIRLALAVAVATPGRGGRRAGVPGQEAFQCRPGDGLAAVTAAFVEVGGNYRRVTLV
jgi:hypothetical protein